MAPRSKHLLVGFIGSIVTTVLLYYFRYPLSTGLVFLILSLSLLGAEMPDYDFFLPGMRHRDIGTHSFFIPLIVFIIAFSMKSSAQDLLILGLFNINYGIHLLIDLWPSVSKKTLEKGGLAALEAITSAFLQGITGIEIKGRMAGTYLIHLPVTIEDERGRERKTFAKKATREWLVFSGFISILFGAITVFYPTISQYLATL